MVLYSHCPLRLWPYIVMPLNNYCVYSYYMAYIDMGAQVSNPVFVALPYIVMAYIIMVYVVMAYIVMAHIVMV